MAHRTVEYSENVADACGRPLFAGPPHTASAPSAGSPAAGCGACFPRQRAVGS